MYVYKRAANILKLAIFRNNILVEMQRCFEHDKSAWSKYNEDLLRISNATLHSLDNMGQSARESLYKELVKSRDLTSMESYIIGLNNGPLSEENQKILEENGKVIDAIDYLEMALQLNFRSEFPNKFINDQLPTVKFATPLSRIKAFESFDDQTDSLTQKTFESSTMGVETESQQSPEIKVELENAEDISNGQDLSLGDNEEYCDKDTKEEDSSSLYFSQHLDYQPKVISLFERYKQEQASQENAQESLEIPVSVASSIHENNPDLEPTQNL